jgi:glycolate oxidase FAD binding subunit
MTISPATADELRDVVRAATTIVVRGAGTKSPTSDRDRPVTIGTGRLRGVVDYVPEECVLTARAGTPVEDLATTLAGHGQYLPFDPPLAKAGATLGGTVAAGVSGPGRCRYGGVRDFVIGARIVDGEGRLIHSGGRVVKNAAGFLLHHAMVGSLGRLGVLIEITIKVFPAPEARTTLRVDCGSLAAALDTLRAVTASHADVDALDFDDGGTMWVRAAGRATSLPGRTAKLRRAIAHPSSVLPPDEDARVWNDAGQFQWATPFASLVKVPITPVQIPDVARLGSPVRFSAAGSVAWLAYGGESAELSRRLGALRLRALIVRGPDAGALVGLSEPNPFDERLRRVLDPRGCFDAAQRPVG